MKSLVVIVMIALALSDQSLGATPNNTNNFYLQMGRAIVQNRLKPFLEDIRPMLKTGNETIDLPAIDPLESSLMQLNFTRAGVTFDNSYKNLVIEGLSEFEINEAKYDSSELLITLNVTFPNLTLTGNYELHTSIFGWFSDFPVYGDGNLRINATNVTIASNVTLGWTFFGTVYARSIQTDLTYDTIDFGMTGLYNSDSASDYLSTVTTVTLPFFIEMYHPIMMESFGNVLITAMNKYLYTLSLQDIFYILSNDE